MEAPGGTSLAPPLDLRSRLDGVVAGQERQPRRRALAMLAVHRDPQVRVWRAYEPIEATEERVELRVFELTRLREATEC